MECGKQCLVACGMWQVAGSGWWAAEIMTSVGISLNLIFSAPTETRSHDASRPLC